jgi:hypothetical protein
MIREGRRGRAGVGFGGGGGGFLYEGQGGWMNVGYRMRMFLFAVCFDRGARQRFLFAVCHLENVHQRYSFYSASVHDKLFSYNYT